MSLLDSAQRFLAKVPLATAVIFALSLGLAPFTPTPHVWEKLRMLAEGSLHRPIDVFDLVLHGTPWILLFAKLGTLLKVSHEK